MNKQEFSTSKIIIFIILMSCTPFILLASRVKIDFNANWKFKRGDNSTYKNVVIDDKDWRIVSVPHDWSFEEGISKSGTQGQSGGYHDGGIGWYRKTFEMEANSKEKAIYIEFDGVYMNSEVWFNGHYLGKRPYGYISFRYEISKYVKEGQNTLAVRVDNSKEPSARWYHPCGIYAPVRMIVTNKLHFAPNSVAVRTPKITKDSAVVNIDFKLLNLADKWPDAYTTLAVISPDGKELLTLNKEINSSEPYGNVILSVKQPELWDLESPKLYTLITRIKNGDVVLDEVHTEFGIREIDWKTETGFYLNGKNIKLKGVSEHYEGGPVGGAWTKPLLRWKINLLKNMGINAIRVTVKPFPPMFYELCDEMGILLIDEIFDGWSKKALYDYGQQAFDEWWERDVEEWVSRDRNHPSIILWGVGNETDGEVAPRLVDLVHKLDPSRMVTSGTANPEDMDVIGINGGSERKTFFETANFKKPFLSTEAPHTWQTRGYYRTQSWFRDGFIPRYYELPDLTEKEIFFDEWAAPLKWNNRKQHFNSSYDNATVRISARKSWELARDLPWYSGQFRWSGFDYYGEAELAHGGWPFRLFMGGIIDVAGFEKDLFYFYQSQWTEKPMAHILPHWTHPHMQKGTLVPVWVYSNADEVELFSNGKSLGKDKPGTVWNEMQCEWLVPYEEGKLEAIAYQGGRQVAKDEMVTAGAPSQLRNSFERLNREGGFDDYFIITTEGVDSNNNIYPYAENRIYYHFDDSIRLVSLENGDPVDSVNQVKSEYRKMFMGKTRAFIQSTNKPENATVTMAVILGDKSLFKSKKITIVADRINLIGEKVDSRLKIKYTVSGKDPLLEGENYSKPFEVTDKTTVKAVVIENGKVLLSLTETFGKEEGFFIGDEKTVNPWKGRGYALQAEDATFGGAVKQTVGKDYRGEGFLDFNGNEGYVKWFQENDGDAKEYILTFRYAHNFENSKCPMTLKVNDILIKVIEFEPTGSLNADWNSITVKVPFQVGSNYIELKSTGSKSPNIDLVTIE